MRIKDILFEVPAIQDRKTKDYPDRRYAGPDARGPIGNELWWVGGKRNFDEKGDSKDEVGKVYGFPNPESGEYKYKNTTTMDAEIDSFQSKGDANRGLPPKHIFWVNSERAPKDLTAFAITQVRNEDGEWNWLGKYVSSTKEVEQSHGNDSRTNNDNNSQNLKVFDSNDVATEMFYRGTRANAIWGRPEEKLGDPLSAVHLAPGDIIPSFKEPNSVDSIINDLKSRFGNNEQHGLYQIAQQAAEGNSPLILTAPMPEIKGNTVQVAKELNYIFNPINVNYTEILHPLTIVSGQGYSGFNLGPMPGATISFTIPGGAKYDSEIKYKGRTIQISSKKAMGKSAGAAAKITFLKEPLKKHTALSKIFPLEYAVLNILANSSPDPKGGTLQALEAATITPSLESAFISKNDAEYLVKLFGNNPDIKLTELSQKTLDDIKNSHDSLYKLIKQAPSKGGIQYPFRGVMNLVMHQLVDYFNSDIKMNDLFKALLDDSLFFMRTDADTNVSNDGKTVTDTLKFTLIKTSDSDAKFNLLARSYQWNGSLMGIQYDLTTGNTESDSGDSNNTPPQQIQQKQKQTQQKPQQKRQTQQIAIPDVDLAGQQQITQSLRTAGTPLNQALMAITDPEERSEAEVEARENITLGKSEQEVLARLQSWLSESTDLIRIKQLINYKY